MNKDSKTTFTFTIDEVAQILVDHLKSIKQIPSNIKKDSARIFADHKVPQNNFTDKVYDITSLTLFVENKEDVNLTKLERIRELEYMCDSEK